MVFYHRLLSLTLFPRFQLCKNSISFFLWLHNNPLCGYTDDGHLGCFYFLAMNIHAQVFVYIVSSSLGYIYLGVELQGHIVPVYKLGENFQTVFQSSLTISHPHQQNRRAPISPTSLSTFVIVCLFEHSSPAGGVK